MNIIKIDKEELIEFLADQLIYACGAGLNGMPYYTKDNKADVVECATRLVEKLEIIKGE